MPYLYNYNYNAFYDELYLLRQLSNMSYHYRMKIISTILLIEIYGKKKI